MTTWTRSDRPHLSFFTVRYLNLCHYYVNKAKIVIDGADNRFTAIFTILVITKTLSVSKDI